MNIAIFISGNGSNLQSIINSIDNSDLTNTEISIVISNNSKAYGLKRAQDANIPNIYSNNENQILNILKSLEVDLIVLAGYLKKISPTILNCYKNKIINIHPSLLPKHGGERMYGKRVHKSVLESGDIETGVTIHWVDEKYDHGKIINQTKALVYKNDNVDTLSKRVLDVEHKILIDTLISLEEIHTKTGNFIK